MLLKNIALIFFNPPRYAREWEEKTDGTFSGLGLSFSADLVLLFPGGGGGGEMLHWQVLLARK